MLVLILIFFIILFGLYFYLSTKEYLPAHTKSLPCEHGVTLLGVIFRMKPSMYVYFNELKRKLGPIFQVKIGIRNAVVLNNITWFKKCFKDNGDIFSGRYAASMIHELAHGSGIILTDGKVWANSRSFTMRVLKDFGLGKSTSQEIVSTESSYMIEELFNSSNDSIVNFKEIIPFHTLNVISKFIMNKRYKKNDENIQTIKDLVFRASRLREPLQLLEMMFPFFEKFNWFTKLSLYMYKETPEFDKVHDIFRQEIKLHEKQLEQKTEAEDLMDRFIVEQKKFSWENIPPEFAEWQLIRISFELYVAGYETTSNTLVWSMLFLAYFPEVQEKVYNEILEKIGKERMPTMNDKKDMPYTQAVMDEIMRLSTVAPVGVFHRTLQNCIIDSYYIPKDTLIIPNIYACHRDRKVWEKPYTFYPEHFLTENGDYHPREELVGFGMGKRQCLGESLARIEMFIFLINIIQKFRVELPRKITEQEFQTCLMSDDSVIRPSSFGEFKFIKH